MKPNRYIKAMEIGLAHEKEGITYPDLIEKLNNSTNEPMGSGAEKTFVVWFIENFSADNYKDSNRNIKEYFTFYLDHRNGKELSSAQRVVAKKTSRTLCKLYWLDGQAAKQYLDYVEYKSARESSQKAQVAAIISILIAAASFYFTYQATKETPKPPYDVKVIEDNSRAEQLESENVKLKDELYKAEMMLEAYESDSVNSGT